MAAITYTYRGQTRTIGTNPVSTPSVPAVPRVGVDDRSGRSDDGTTGYPSGPIAGPVPAAPGTFTPPPYVPGQLIPRAPTSSAPPGNTPAPPGFDAAKWTDPTQGTSHKYLGGNALSSGLSVDQMLALPQFSGWTRVSDDKVRSPEGSVYDVYYDYGGPNQRVQWTWVGGGPRGGSGSGAPPGDPRWHDGIPGNAAAAGPNPALEALKHDGIPGNYAAAVRSGVVPGQASLPPAGSPLAGYSPQFSDPGTSQLERYLIEQMNALEGQRNTQAQANTGLQSQQDQANQATQRLVSFLTQRAQQLQQPAYTGAEQEILRTQMLDPIERDRTAANQRALENVGSRGFDPTSGIAQQLFGDVNRAYDQQRAAAQGDLAYRQVNERRSRDQETQALLSAIPQVQSGSAAQQLQFMQALDAALNQPRQQGLNLSQMLYRLPAQAQSDALAAMGMGPSGDAVFQQAMGLYNAQQQQANQGLGYYQMLGSLLPYLTGQGG